MSAFSVSSTLMEGFAKHAASVIAVSIERKDDKP
jgi:hypothetical protein